MSEPSTYAEWRAEVERLRAELAAAEKVQVTQYQHESACDWVTNNSWCNCGLDEAWERAVQTEAVVAADRLLAENDALTEGIRALLANLAKADPHHFSIGLMCVRLHALLNTERTEPTP